MAATSTAMLPYFAAHVTIHETGDPLRRSSDTGNCDKCAIVQHFKAIVVDGKPNLIAGAEEMTAEVGTGGSLNPGGFP